MARTVDSRWYETYLNAKKVFENQGQSSTLASVAAALGMNQKTLNRMVVAGRYLDRCLPTIDPSQVRCSYVQMELLDKISRLSPPLAEELLLSALANKTSIAELTQQLDTLRTQSPLLAHAINARADKRRTAKCLIRDLFTFLARTPLEYFEAAGGTVLKSAAPSPFQAPTAALLDREGSSQAVFFCKVGADSRPASGVAMDLYELAHARRSMARKVWMVFPERSDVFMHLAELSLWLGGSPLHQDTGWLRLAHFHAVHDKLTLKVLFEDECAQLLADISSGKGLFEPQQLAWRGAPIGHPDAVTDLGIGYTPELPEASSRRSYPKYLIATARKQTTFLKRLSLEDDFFL